MNPPLAATPSLDRYARQALRLRVIFECCKWDLQREDHPVLAPYALILDREHWSCVAAMAEQLTCEALAIERELIARPDLHSHLGLPGPIRRVFRDPPSGCHGRSIRVMRFDFHFTRDGWKISEVNADVPGGFIESSGFSQRMAEHFHGLNPIGNPSSTYAEAISALAGSGGSIALVHATGYSDDRQVMEYLAGHLRTQGLTATVVSPTHIRFEDHCATLHSRFASGRPDLLVRFFPAEWLPNLGHASKWSGFFFCRDTVLSNPATALLIQTKRLPLIWARLSSRTDAWRALLPEVRCPRDTPESESEEWVFKPALGRVGEDVAIAGVTSPDRFAKLFEQTLRRPTGWIAQRRFDSVAIETPEGPRHPCLGVFTIDGRAAGCYGRISHKALIDADAQDVAILIESEEKHGA